MELLAAYAEKDGGGEPPLKRMRVSAPAVQSSQKVSDELLQLSTREVYYNPTAETLYAPLSGPQKRNGGGEGKNFWTGYLEQESVNEAAFDEEYHSFERRGFAADPAAPLHTPQQPGAAFAGNKAAALASGSATLDQLRGRKRKRVKGGAPDSDSYLGPWAPFEDEKSDSEEEVEEVGEKEKEREEKEREEREEKEREEKEAAEKAGEEDDEEEELPPCREESSVFHGKERYDYQGRTYLSPPSGLKVRDHDCFLPKKKVHTWSGHSKAVTAIRFFPRTGHLLLSASMDGKAKVYEKRRVLRTFIGHSKGIRDICWNSDGSRFLTASYDKWVKLWDTESGECLGRFSNGQVPYCVAFNPEDENEFLAGYHDKKIIQWDISAGQVVQEYDRHLGAVNTITFLSGGRFVSTSDDKSMRVWEYGIPVDVKLISEPHLHSVPAVTLSPDGKNLACTSLDNQVMIYSAGSKFKANNNKSFKGHFVSSFACKTDFSPDGRFLISGDASGQLFGWDYRSQEVLTKLKAHSDVCIGVAWHPVEPSKVATCGWDGKIHYWD